jgi:conserved domain protein|nr:MAG TPA: Protein of unknown function (DUF1018) [Caudoviricetes sp.]
MNTSELKKYYIKMIQTLKHNYFVDDECRKVYLQAKYGKDSLTKLSIDELREVLILLGYKPSTSAQKPITKVGYATKKQLNMIDAMWNERARVKTQMALRNFIFRILGYRPLHLFSLKKGDASKIIIALKHFKKECQDDKQP